MNQHNRAVSIGGNRSEFKIGDEKREGFFGQGNMMTDIGVGSNARTSMGRESVTS